MSWGLFVRVGKRREKRAEKPILPWHPDRVPFHRFDVPEATWQPPLWTPDPPLPGYVPDPCGEPGVWVKYRDGGFR
jgi:hypothetical protein